MYLHVQANKHGITIIYHLLAHHEIFCAKVGKGGIKYLIYPIVCVIKKYFSCVSTKAYVVCTQKNRLNETGFFRYPKQMSRPAHETLALIAHTSLCKCSFLTELHTNVGQGFSLWWASVIVP